MHCPALVKTSTHRLLITLIATLGAWGCSQPNIKSDYVVAAATTSGVVTGSITYEGAYGAYILHLIGPEGRKYRISHGEPQTFNLVKAIGGEGENALLGRSGSPFAVELPAGDYRVESWQISSGAANVWSEQPTNLAFRVSPRQAIYLGNFHFFVTDTFMRNPKSAVVTLKDERTRDLAAVRSAFPALANVPVTTTLAPGTVLERVGGSSRGRIQITPVYMPIAR